MSEEIKNAFNRVKQDIFSLGDEISKLKFEILDLKTDLKLISSFIEDLKIKLSQPSQQSKPVLVIKPLSPISSIPAQKPEKPANNPQTSTYDKIPTDKLLSQVLKRQNLPFSTGNEGVPTDRQTNRQTNQQTQKQEKISELSVSKPPETHIPTLPEVPKKPEINHLEKAHEILTNLDALKKEIRRKFKALTPQEMLVFSSIYTLEETNPEVDYKLLATTLKLSESSIRDYIGKIQRKGIPIIKEKLNNKLILLKISPELKKIASLDAILKLREI